MQLSLMDPFVFVVIRFELCGEVIQGAHERVRKMGEYSRLKWLYG